MLWRVTKLLFNERSSTLSYSSCMQDDLERLAVVRNSPHAIASGLMALYKIKADLEHWLWTLQTRGTCFKTEFIAQYYVMQIICQPRWWPWYHSRPITWSRSSLWVQARHLKDCCQCCKRFWNSKSYHCWYQKHIIHLTWIHTKHTKEKLIKESEINPWQWQYPNLHPLCSYCNSY